MALIRERLDATGQKTYQAQIRIKGVSPQTRTFAAKTDAKRWARQTEVDIHSGMHIRQSKESSRTFSELLDKYNWHFHISSTRRTLARIGVYFPLKAEIWWWQQNLK